DSLLGTYKSPDFSQPGAFQNIPSTYNPLEKETITVTVRLKNYGSETASARLQWRQKNIDFPEVELIDGNTEMQGFIAPGQELVMRYREKLNKALKLDLP
ncbi:hypothetical protein HZB89_00965, partial [archaeon]|nr:hypothetical protein [archaeon]